MQTQILIVGGGTGGCAAALAAADMGCRVIMTEETDWIGGQLTQQAVPPDENPWIENGGCTLSYSRFREGVRQYYRDHYPLKASARRDPWLNPGNGMVSRLCHEPRVGHAVLQQMLSPAIASGRLTVLLRAKPIAAETDGDRIVSVSFRDLEHGHSFTIEAPYVLDATELGELLPMAGVEYVSGAESQRETGEPHAVAGDAQPGNVQAISWCFAVGFDPDGEHVIEKPAQYERWRDYAPTLSPAWPGRMLSMSQTHPITLEPLHHTFFRSEHDTGLWEFRRVICKDYYAPTDVPHDVTLVNWPMIDYLEGNLIDASEEDLQRYLYESRQQSLSFLYWLQTEQPRDDGGVGYPELYPRGDITGTHDGLAKYPYIRESRRIRARVTVTENHVGLEARSGTKDWHPEIIHQYQAEPFADSVGIGSYRIDLHPSTGMDNYIDIASLPFRIPLGALIPVRMRNLLPACKNLGVTHLSNGCYRLHPVEWNIGEAAGALAAHCLARHLEPQQVHDSREQVAAFQLLLEGRGVPLRWPFDPNKLP